MKFKSFKAPSLRFILVLYLSRGLLYIRFKIWAPNEGWGSM